MVDARQIAAEALIKVETQNSWSNLVWDAQLKKYKPDSRDSAFAGALFYGVLERALTLDACIAAHCSTAPKKLSPVVRTCLRLALHQILYMDSVPEHAAVDESVNLVRKLRQPRAAGLVNAVLRSFLRAGKVLPATKKDSLAQTLSLAYSCPLPLVDMWLASYGEEHTQRLLQNSLGRPPLFIRANTLRITVEDLRQQLQEQGMEVIVDSQLPECLRLEKCGSPTALPEFKQGLFHVQDKASQLCALALNAQPGQHVLDACAAPGGKSFTLAQIMQNRGHLVAIDLHAHRTKKMQQRAKQMGTTIVQCQTADMTQPQPNLGEFDRILCDVPCSGFGVIRRKPEIKYKPLEEFESLPNIQYKILENTAQYCKVGGRLIYSTCTLHPAENEGVVDRFLKHNPSFVPAPLYVMEKAERYTFLGTEETDGFFLAAMTRIH